MGPPSGASTVASAIPWPRVPLELSVPALEVHRIAKYPDMLPVDAAPGGGIVDHEVEPAACSVLICDLRLELVVDVAPEEFIRENQFGLRADQGAAQAPLRPHGRRIADGSRQRALGKQDAQRAGTAATYEAIAARQSARA